MGPVNSWTVYIFLTLLSYIYGSGLKCFMCTNVHSPACGVHMERIQYEFLVECNNNTVKCATQLQQPEDNWTGVLRGCYEAGMISGIDESDGCREWTNNNGYSATYCFCSTDACNWDDGGLLTTS